MALLSNLWTLLCLTCTMIHCKPYTSEVYATPGSGRRSSVFYTDFDSTTRGGKIQRTTFLPNRQYCPETGRTVCSEVEDYPADKLYDTVRKIGSQRFNFSTLFVDERENDSEPKLDDIPVNYIPKQYPKGRFVYQTSIHYDYQPVYASAFDGYGIPSDQTHFFGKEAVRAGVKGYDTTSVDRQSRAHSTLHDSDQTPQSSNYDYSPWRPIMNTRTARAKLNFQKNISKKHYDHKGHFRRIKRQAFRNKAEDVCETQKMYISPKVALNDKSEWKYIVNLGDRDPKFKQIIKVDVCRSPKSTCSKQISIPFGYTSKCKQKYIKKKLLAFNSDGEGTSSENFFVPSCCVCKLIRSR